MPPARPERALAWDQFYLPAEYEGPPCVTSIGWCDPRTEYNEFLWPSRFGAPEIESLKRSRGDGGVGGFVCHVGFESSLRGLRMTIHHRSRQSKAIRQENLMQNQMSATDRDDAVSGGARLCISPIRHKIAPAPFSPGSPKQGAKPPFPGEHPDAASCGCLVRKLHRSNRLTKARSGCCEVHKDRHPRFPPQFR